MGKRREGRETAIQFLYQLDLNRQPITEALDTFWKIRSGPGDAAVSKKTRTYTEQLVRGITTHLPDIDARIVKYASNYSIDRIAIVDRNVLRLGIYELLHCPDVPPVVIINEALEVVKRFGGEESARFVNGILDRVRAELTRPLRTPAQS